MYCFAKWGPTNLGDPNFYTNTHTLQYVLSYHFILYAENGNF